LGESYIFKPLVIDIRGHKIVFREIEVSSKLLQQRLSHAKSVFKGRRDEREGHDYPKQHYNIKN